MTSRIAHLATRILVPVFALALAGQGCAPAPAVAPQPAPAAPPVVAPSPTPAPTPTPKPTPAPAPTPKKPSGTTVVPKTVVVEMKDNIFSPQIVAVNQGDTVVWKNVGKMNHTSTDASGALLWDSGSVAPGKTFSRKFTATGTYKYNCSIHKGMSGTVIVGAVQATK